MGIHVVITGTGCREIEASVDFAGWPLFLSHLIQEDVNFTRFDLAKDDMEGKLNLNTIHRHWREGWIVKRYSKVKTYESDTSGAVRIEGMDFGTRASETMIRLYDKAIQQGITDHWIRVELEAHGKRAQALVQAFIEGGPEIVAGIIRGYLDFKKPDADGRKDRREPADWWLKFLSNAERARLYIAPRQNELERQKKWLLSISAVYAEVHDSLGGGTLHQEMLNEGRHKLKRRLRGQIKPSTGTYLHMEAEQSKACNTYITARIKKSKTLDRAIHI